VRFESFLLDFLTAMRRQAMMREQTAHQLFADVTGSADHGDLLSLPLGTTASRVFSTTRNAYALSVHSQRILEGAAPSAPEVWDTTARVPPTSFGAHKAPLQPD